MRRLLNFTLQRRKIEACDVTTSEPRDVVSSPHAQDQSILFRLLSADIRMLIHEEALSDMGHLLHIVPYVGKRKRKVMGHWHCTDQKSEFPLWQHSCFGLWLEDDTRHRRLEPRSNSNLMSWLLACRRIYLEAIDVLYTVNELNFRGASGVLLFRSQLPEHNWNKIRRLSISTVFLVPMRMALAAHVFLPPENYANWKAACETVASLRSLRCFTVDMVIKNWYDGKSWMANATKGVETEAFMSILSPINSIKVNEMVVEMNVEIPDDVVKMLGPLNFKVEQRHRPYNSRLFPRPSCCRAHCQQSRWTGALV
ncbi:hypothetical protein DE146DRAFT_239 [Phaeosphaeria sp. MPI-PUGE-AT-0046c]|nr:hypothetical protein DE146DRAFT_239 [Phaeosphaeria sp. MPI-PUGE-AT-0046c]